MPSGTSRITTYKTVFNRHIGMFAYLQQSTHAIRFGNMQPGCHILVGPISQALSPLSHRGGHYPLIGLVSSKGSWSGVKSELPNIARGALMMSPVVAEARVSRGMDGVMDCNCQPMACDIMKARLHWRGITVRHFPVT